MHPIFAAVAIGVPRVVRWAVLTGALLVAVSPLAAQDAPNLGLAEVRADPERFAGAAVRWRVQFVALQRADSLRADMTVGERYLLVRDPGGESGFVYVVVTAAHLPAIAALAPLQRVEVAGRIRSARSPLTGHPILELLELRP